MKLKNHDYILTSNIIITGILQINYFNVFGLISLILSIAYLGIILFASVRSRILFILYVSSVVTGMVYYFLNPIFSNSNISMLSIIPSIFLLIEIFHATTMPIIKRNSFSGIRTPLALENDEVWEKVNNVGSILCYITLFPFYIMIFYFNDNLKTGLSIATILLFTFLALGIAFFIEKKYIIEENQQEKIELQNQRKKETGG